MTTTSSSQKPKLIPVNDIDLQIRGVVLYKHGVAYVEREGKVKDNSRINLFFKSEEMNDVLKSLTTLDLNGGIISSITYAANRSVADQLNDIQLRIPEGQSLTGLLNQLKGSHVHVTTDTGKEIDGIVLGTQMIEETDQFTTHSKPLLSLLVEGAKLCTVSLVELQSIQLLDGHLQQDLQYILNILFNAKKKDSKQLTIHATGTGERTVYLSYTVAAPLWKTSYRLLLEKKDNKEVCTLQALAIVDNTMDEDWNNVKLSLVSGLPVSFVHDLYNPRYKKRPTVQVKDTDQSYNAPVLEPAAVGGFYQGTAAVALPKNRRVESSQSASVILRNVEAGDTFHYEIKHAVTVKRNGAALVPILTSTVQAERLVVFNKEVRDKFKV
jgi:hypothetical protein